MTEFEGQVLAELRVLQNQMERSIKQVLAKSGFYEHKRIQVGKLLDSVGHLIAPEMVGG